MQFFQKLIFLVIFLVFAACSPKTVEKERPSTDIKEPKLDYSRATKSCYLTFDDGPHKNDLKLIEILAQYDAKATFFYNGYNVPGKEDIVRKVVASGHALGNHSYGHKNLQTLSAQYQYLEIKKNQDLLTKYADVKAFRPGYGASTNYSHTVLKSQGLVEVKWNVDTFDWKAPSSQYIIDRAKKAQNYTKPIILMHSTSNKTVQALPEILKMLKDQGCRFRTF